MIMPTVKTRIFALGCLFELASAPVVQTVAQNGQYIYDVQDGEADIFGQLRYEKNVNGTGLVKLNTANPNGYKWVSDYGYQAGVTPITTAGTYVGSEYYAYETTLYANTLMPRAISVVDVNTGEYTAKREIENSTTEAPLILDEMTYDPKTNRIFGLHYDTSANKSYIYEIDRKTLDIALVATIDKVLFYTLAADNGSLYAVRKGGMKSYLSKIDISSINKTTKTCEYKDLGNTNVYLGDFIQTMEFDKTTHRLWWMAQTSDGNAYLVELNPQTGAQIKKEFIDNEMQLLGMGIPYQYVTDGAPSYPRAFKATADAKGALSAQLSWTTQSVSYLDAKLSSLTGTKVYRNDQLVYTSTETTQGKSVAWTDRPSTDSYYIYKVVPYNAAGDGVYKEFAAYVGEDLPGAPQNVTLTTHGGNAEITWAAPAEGKHGGYFDNASVKYNVVRMPDNKVVVEGITSLRATDAVSVQKGYSYVMTAVNKKGVGASATSKTMSFGPEDSVPFTSPLTTQDDFDRWVTADKNNDGNITIQGNANDLELVVNLDKPYKYEGGNVIMKFECPLGTQYIKDSTKHPDWHMMEMDGNPHIAYCSGEDEDANVWGELLMPFISIAYKDNGSTGIFAIGGDKNGVTRSGDSLLFDECADEARLYSATGALVASAQRANALSVAGLAKGIYVLKLTKGGAVRSLKVEF